MRSEIDSISILRDLVAFPTISRTPNAALIEHVAALLRAAGARVTIIESHEGERLNLLATIGPDERPGILLSGHCDVVPVSGQTWSTPPFELVDIADRLHGRGTADMKGFLACAIAAMAKAGHRQAEFATPLHLAISCDEEVGCVGVRSLLAHLPAHLPAPLLCIVGEPTSMRIATGHKGKLAARATCIGRAAHSALAPNGLNAIHFASDLVSVLRDEQAILAAGSTRDNDYDLPWSTIHAGLIQGGVALNIVPDHCTLDFEIRTIAGDDAEAILDRIRARAEDIAAASRPAFPEAAITIEQINAYPGLDTQEIDAIAYVSSLIGANGRIKVSFGTEGGLFSQTLQAPVVICGPGSMDQGHQGDEYVSRDQIARCDAMLAALIDRLARA
jgi:acetylornithine deacetylase